MKGYDRVSMIDKYSKALESTVKPTRATVSGLPKVSALMIIQAKG